MKAIMFGVALVTAVLLVSAPAVADERGNSCWGQASAVFARMGMMGQHASQQDEPRLGLANLARELFDAGILSEPTIAALGAFVADELGLDIERCASDQGAVVEAEAAMAASAACWGQASAVFAQMGMMGQHASQEPTPRLGLRNLARALADAGVIPDGSMESLGMFVADALGLAIDACS